MISAPPVVSVASPVSPNALVLARRAETDDLGETIAALARRLHAATYELLVLLREFDAGSGWNNGFLSCAHWLHSTPTRTPRASGAPASTPTRTPRASGAPAWRTGIDLGAAREKVRVAKALPALPRISAAMQHGQVSYAKVRALTRVATAENERSLLDLALAGNCAHVERFVRAWRRVDRVQAAREGEAKHLNRQLSTWVDDDGMVVIRGRLTPEVGAVVQRALKAAAERLFREASGASTGDAMAEELTPAQRRADALALLAESAMAAHFDGGTVGDRYQVVLHVNAAESEVDRGAPTAGAPSAPLDGAIEVDHGALYVSTETSQRLSCDASLVHMRHEADEAVIDVGRKTRTIPPSIRRALAARDTNCRFPGCTSRRCDAHHLKHWADGGVTRLDNLVLLCRRHHRAVHEGGFGVIRGLDGALTFLRPDGAPLEVAPAAPFDLPGLHHATPLVAGTLPTWDGTRFDLPWAIDVIRFNTAVLAHGSQDSRAAEGAAGAARCG